MIYAHFNGRWVVTLVGAESVLFMIDLDVYLVLFSGTRGLIKRSGN